MSKFNLLSVGNPKIQKGAKYGYLTLGLHLAPYKLSGKLNTCKNASPGCIASCLNTAGRGGMFKHGENTNIIQKARIRKTELFYNDLGKFKEILIDDIEKGIIYAKKHGLIPCARLNLTSDLPWEKLGIIEQFPDLQFYDYTKILGRKTPKNYHLTFSRSEVNHLQVNEALQLGMNVAAVFHSVPSEYLGYQVIDGDDHDLRFLDQKGVIVGLKAKGKAKKDSSGFVI